MINPDLFEPYEKLITVELNGRKRQVPENNTILRCLQYVSAETISYGDLCWNGDCLNCKVTIARNGKEKTAFACIVKAEDGMSIKTVSPEISIGSGDDG